MSACRISVSTRPPITNNPSLRSHHNQDSSTAMSVTQTSKGKGEGDAATYESVSPKPDSKPQSFEDSASTYSRWSMAFMDPLFEKGFSQGIEQEDLGPVSEQDDTYTIYQAFWKHWKQEELKPEKKRDLVSLEGYIS